MCVHVCRLRMLRVECRALAAPLRNCSFGQICTAIRAHPYITYTLFTVWHGLLTEAQEFKDASSPPPHPAAYLRCQLPLHQNRTYDSTNLFGSAFASYRISSIFFFPSRISGLNRCHGQSINSLSPFEKCTPHQEVLSKMHVDHISIIFNQ